MSMDKPDGVYPSAITSSSSQMPGFIPDPSIRGEAWDQLLQNRGIRFIHKIAIPCPNMNGLDTNSHEPDCQICDNSGILYYAEKEIIGAFGSNSLEKNFERQGVWEFGTALCSFPTEYADGSQADFNTFDQLVVQDFTVRVHQLKEYEPRTSHQQGLRYPIEKIDFIASVVNNVVVPYRAGVHYNLVDGKIQWIVGKEPRYNNSTERGEVYVVSYFCRPVYTVVQPLRELRVSQQMVNGVKVAKRLPQHVLCKRDFLLNPAEKISDQ